MGSLLDLKTESLRRRIRVTLDIHAHSPQSWWPTVPSFDWLRHVVDALSTPDCKGQTFGSCELAIDGAVIGRASPEFCDAVRQLHERGVIVVDARTREVRLVRPRPLFA